jgi:hypothetical protein
MDLPHWERQFKNTTKVLSTEQSYIVQGEPKTTVEASTTDSVDLLLAKQLQKCGSRAVFIELCLFWATDEKQEIKLQWPFRVFASWLSFAKWNPATNELDQQCMHGSLVTTGRQSWSLCSSNYITQIATIYCVYQPANLIELHIWQPTCKLCTIMTTTIMWSLHYCCVVRKRFYCTLDILTEAFSYWRSVQYPGYSYWTITKKSRRLPVPFSGPVASFFS